MGRHPGAQHAVATVVALSLLPDDRLRLRLLAALYRLAGRGRIYAGLSRRDQPRPAGRGDRGGSGRARRADLGARQSEPRPDCGGSQAAPSLRSRTGRPPSATIARPATAPAGQGQPGYPNLTAGRWLWGGNLDQIDLTITHGIRADDPDTHTSQMPSFGKDGILKPEQIQQVANYVRSIDKLATEPGVDLAAGKKIFADNGPSATARTARATSRSARRT